MNKTLIRCLAGSLLLASAAAHATSVTGAKISRVRLEANGNIAVTSTIVPAAGCRTATVEHYIFDGRTDIGRAKFAVALVAFATQARVDLIGTGTCIALGATQVELLNTISIF